MAFDPPTILTLTIAIAAAAALYLLLEWRSTRDASLLYWSTGFASITVGCSLALLRASGYFMIGVWFANGLLVFAHWMFLAGVARFVGARLPRAWWLIIAVWCALLVLPDGPTSAKIYLIVNSLLVALLSLRASLLLRLPPDVATLGTRQLHYTLLVHGIFYLAKVALTLVPGELIDLVVYRGMVIRVSLVEGVMAILLIALSMTGTVRYRRERQIEHLAERDPLTALFNRRAFEARAPRYLERVSQHGDGALLLIDVDNFKLVNDLYGHAAGDRLLVTLSELMRHVCPDNALTARLGGDEFAILLDDAPSESVTRLGDELRARFHDHASRTFDTPDAVTLSIGATLFDQPSDLTALIDRGDIALYEVKRSGRDRLRVLDLTEPEQRRAVTACGIESTG
ncbi:GGDEF domain-containing protein [Salinicola sp. CPA57]|uniref:GGDEF domain-containing protein n=1 Tax=Salinicola sp. CPA57 TaxID=1949080 RepID=UPI000DA2289D|nr:GGDEF domain-containing protein [Salinicola sp. CPA57]